MKTCGRYNFTILDLGTKWRLGVSFTPLPLYLRINVVYRSKWNQEGFLT
jgi:hypothetical protein